MHFIATTKFQILGQFGLMKNYFIASEKSVTATVENCDTNKLGGSVNISVSQNKIV